VVREVMDAYLLDEQGHLKPEFAGGVTAHSAPHI
jgi:penicillin-binding protein 2